DGEVLHYGAQGGIARQGYIPRSLGGGDAAQVLILDVAVDRAAAELVRAAGGGAVQHKADLLVVEGAHRHRVAELVEAEGIVGLNVETRQRLQHLQPGDPRRGRQQRVTGDRDGVAGLVGAD